MATDIIVISGFLGAGKTTLIQKLLSEAFENQKVVLIENDFGDISVDAALLKSGGVEVKEMNSGCICCSLSGDFVKALKELLTRFAPDKIIIEPSGVGKLSDIIKACEDPQVAPLVRLAGKITVVDVKRCRMYLENFGEFFEDQIGHADVVLLSRTQDFPQKVDEARQVVRSLNAHAVLLASPWEQLSSESILHPQQHNGQERSALQQNEHHHEHDEHCSCGHHHHEHDEHCDCGHHHHEHHEHCGCGHHHHEHDEHCGCGHHHHEHDEHCGCGHNHAAEEVFDTLTLHTNRRFDSAILEACVAQLERKTAGTVLRMKGIVHGAQGHLNVQYLPGDLKITPCDTPGDMLCIIGHELNRQELLSLFLGE